jgi:hypothetical protein
MAPLRHTAEPYECPLLDHRVKREHADIAKPVRLTQRRSCDPLDRRCTVIHLSHHEP